jgi:hypothetical protein
MKAEQEIREQLRDAVACIKAAEFFLAESNWQKVIDVTQDAIVVLQQAKGEVVDKRNADANGVF